MADGTLKVGTITTSSGSGNITIGSGVTLQNAVPAFEAYLGSDTTISDATYTKVEFNTEVYDTDSTYDNSSNYRFTPAIAGKYYIYGNILMETTGGHELDLGITSIYKNGSAYRQTVLNPSSNSLFGANIFIDAVMDLNATDYIEIFAYIDRTSSGDKTIKATTKSTYFGAYKLGA